MKKIIVSVLLSLLTASCDYKGHVQFTADVNGDGKHDIQVTIGQKQNGTQNDSKENCVP